MIYQKKFVGVEATDELRALLRECQQTSSKGISTSLTEDANSDSDRTLSVDVLQAMASILDDPKRLDAALANTRLAYSTPPPPEEPTLEQEKFRKRLERLRLKQEETQYSQLTSNVGIKQTSDDITTKSMTYAASIGLNMIVAPLSFGCFMYFFAGGILEYVWPRDEVDPRHHQGPDIRRVIAGVVSGVIMLMIEMILFVIRTHEMDAAMRRKQKRPKDGPFSHYTSKTNKTFKGE